MSKSQRDKGYRAELEAAKVLGGQRVPLSGAVKGYYGDVKALGLVWQVKHKGQAQGFKLLYEWLKGHDALLIRKDYAGWLVVIPAETFLNMVEDAS